MLTVGLTAKLQTSATAVLLAASGLIFAHTNADADEIIPIASLAGTVWAASEPHDRTTIAADGTISLKESKDIFVAFGDLIDGVYTVKVNWWNVDAGLNVVEYAVLVPEEENVFDYIEVAHPQDSGFPGIQGFGTFEVLDENTAKFTQAGRLLDGSASAFVTELTKVDKEPTVPIAQTYPKP
jgi:hypothetical protein